jgi:hypothetical protein
MTLALSLSYSGPVERGMRFDQAVNLRVGPSVTAVVDSRIACRSPPLDKMA